MLGNPVCCESTSLIVDIALVDNADKTATVIIPLIILISLIFSNSGSGLNNNIILTTELVFAFVMPNIRESDLFFYLDFVDGIKLKFIGSKH